MQSLIANAQCAPDASQFLQAPRRAEVKCSVDADDTVQPDSRTAQGAALALVRDTVSQAILDQQQTVEGFRALSDQVENDNVLPESGNVTYIIDQISDLAQATKNVALQNQAGVVEQSLLYELSVAMRADFTASARSDNRTFLRAICRPLDAGR